MAWTPEQQKWLKKYLKPQIDKVWGWWGPRNEARRRAEGNMPHRQICAHCKEEWPRSFTQVDHIDPTVEISTGFSDYGTYIERKFVQADALQVLCKTCHSVKTAVEATERAKVRKRKKKESANEAK